MKRIDLFFSFIFLPIDFLMLVLAAITAYKIRFNSLVSGIRPVIYELPQAEYFKIVILVASLLIIIFALEGLYNIKSEKRFVKEFYQIVVACSIGLVMIVLILFFKRELFSSRFVILAAWLLSIIYVGLGRTIIRQVRYFLFKKKIGLKNIVIIGDNNSANSLIREFHSNIGLGYNVVKHFKNFSNETEKQILHLVKDKKVDEIIHTNINVSKDEIFKIILFTEKNYLEFKYVADLFGARVANKEIITISGIPVVVIKKTPLDGWGRINKRIFDFISAIFLIVITSPILVLTALLVKLDSKGPIIYKNKRVNKEGEFNLYKFRSMFIDYCTGDDYDKNNQALAYERKLIEKQNFRKGAIYKIKDDPRITKFGKFIRRWSIDELPQLFNVIIGNMSLVGPRPHQLREVEKYTPIQKKVLTIKPGITGMAQISGRSDLSTEEETKLDMYYIENWSLLLDIIILLRTPSAVIRSRKVE